MIRKISTNCAIAIRGGGKRGETKSFKVTVFGELQKKNRKRLSALTTKNKEIARK